MSSEVRIRDLSLVKSQSVGVISTFSIEQFLRTDFDVKQLNLNDYISVIDREAIEVVFIEKSIYERDHQWYSLETDTILDIFKDIDVNVIFIEHETENMNLKFTYINEKGVSDTQISPFFIDEKKFNPVNEKKNIDTLILKMGSYDDNFKKWLKTVTFSKAELDFYEVNKKNIELLSISIKEAKVLYIPFYEVINNELLVFIELICTFQNTVLVIDEKYSYHPTFGYKGHDDQSTFYSIQSYSNNTLFRDKKVIQSFRQSFLKHSLVRYKGLSRALSGSERDTYPSVSVITSTIRKRNLIEYIDRLNKQEFVSLEVILLTHGFKLQVNEIVELEQRSNFKLIILSEDKSTIFGSCLNLCIEEASHDFIAKMDDDDFYFRHYLIDSWIGLQFSDADLVGKYSQFIYIESLDITVKRFTHLQNRFSRYVAGATLFTKTEFIRKYMFAEKSKAVDSDIIQRMLNDQARVYCLNPYEFCIFRGKELDLHTWKIPDLNILTSSKVMFYGRPHETLTC